MLFVHDANQHIRLDARRPSHPVSVAHEHGIAFYDALIVAAAVEAGCDTLFSEDMQPGRKLGSLIIVNPFIESARE